MKWLCVMLLFVAAEASAQCKTFIIGKNGDTLNCTDVKGNRQGKWVVHVDQVRMTPGYEEEGTYVDGKKEGTWRQYTLDGDLKAIESYRWGLKDGLNQYYNVMAGLIREERWKALDPQNPYDTIDVQDVNEPNKFVKVRVKLEGTTLRHGTWKYYDQQTGALVKTEEWYLNKIKDPNDKTSATAATDNKASSDSTKPATPKIKPPKVVEDFDKKNSGKKKVKVRDGRTGG